MADEKKPAISAELIAMLERIYPDKCPDLGTSIESVWFKAGQATVVRTLRRLYTEQNPLS